MHTPKEAVTLFGHRPFAGIDALARVIGISFPAAGSQDHMEAIGRLKESGISPMEQHTSEDGVLTFYFLYNKRVPSQLANAGIIEDPEFIRKLVAFSRMNTGSAGVVM